MYPWSKAVRTQETMGNAAWENIPKRAGWLHANLGRHPLDIALWARREGDGFASLRRVIHHLVLCMSIAKNLSIAIDASPSGTIKLLRRCRLLRGYGTPFSIPAASSFRSVYKAQST